MQHEHIDDLSGESDDGLAATDLQFVVLVARRRRDGERVRASAAAS